MAELLEPIKLFLAPVTGVWDWSIRIAFAVVAIAWILAIWTKKKNGEKIGNPIQLLFPAVAGDNPGHGNPGLPGVANLCEMHGEKIDRISDELLPQIRSDLRALRDRVLILEQSAKGD